MHVILRENPAGASIVAPANWVLGCQEVRKDLQLTLGVFLERLRENLDDAHSCQFEYFHLFFFFFFFSSTLDSTAPILLLWHGRFLLCDLLWLFVFHLVSSSQNRCESFSFRITKTVLNLPLSWCAGS